MSNSTRKLAGLPSAYLDLLRIAAALTVVFMHGKILLHQANATHLAMSHAAVIVFFVLSGFVIAHTTTYRTRSRIEYAEARMSRLYSVLLPSLTITALIQCYLYFFDLELFTEFTRGNSLPRYLLTLTFTNELWWLSAGPVINGAVWSLSYEFWYYVIFGFYFYRHTFQWGIGLAILTATIAGPKILLLMPIWIGGCWAYHLPRPRISNYLLWGVVFISMVTAIFCMFLPGFPKGIGKTPWFYSGQFISDNLIGLLVSISLWSLPNGTKAISLEKAIYLIRKAGDLTFPLYLLHVPFLILMISIFGQSIPYYFLTTLVVIVSCIVGNYFEILRVPISLLFRRLSRVKLWA